MLGTSDCLRVMLAARSATQQSRENHELDGVRSKLSIDDEDQHYPDWHPNQLRHNAANSLRKKHGPFAAIWESG